MMMTMMVMTPMVVILYISITALLCLLVEQSNALSVLPLSSLSSSSSSSLSSSPLSSSCTYHTNHGSLGGACYDLYPSSRFRSASSSWSSALFMAKRSSELIMSQPWLPDNTDDDDIFAIDEERLMLERKSIDYLSSLLSYQLMIQNRNQNRNRNDEDTSTSTPTLAMELAHDRFRDLACTIEGELRLEQIFHIQSKDMDMTLFTYLSSDHDQQLLKHQQRMSTYESDPDIIRGAIIALQSFLMLGMQVGVKGRPEQKERSLAHLKGGGSGGSSGSGSGSGSGSKRHDSGKKRTELDVLWDTYSSRRLKHKTDITAGTQLLAEMKRKRTAQSAFDVLVSLGAWTIHEDVALLRSGFPIRFTIEEEEAAIDAGNDPNDNDPDSILKLRKDLRHLKAYTIDAEWTDDIDDALSIENVRKDDGTERKRIWIHIADADRWAPRDSKIFKSAQLRATSVYLPQGSVPMFPSCLSGGTMALRADTDSCALSLGVELNDDGSIDESTLLITPSIINVNYRLAYDEVDEMLEFGVGYFEEWELGALSAEANKRRKYRISCGSTEGFVPRPIPQAELRVVTKKKKNVEDNDSDSDNEVEQTGDNDLDDNSSSDNDNDDVDILLNVEVTHNSGTNQSEAVLDMNALSSDDDFAPPVSTAYLLVTEMMIMSGEAMGKLKNVLESKVEKIYGSDSESDLHSKHPMLENKLNLPFRTQPKPDFGQRYQELRTLDSLREKGLGYCHAWYARRFFEPVRVMEDPLPHHGLGLDCYVQWTSPIRRFSDLQVHASVKRFLRKHRVNQMMEAGLPIPDALTASDIGCEVPRQVESSKLESGLYTKYTVDEMTRKKQEAYGINYKKGLGFVNAARMVQKKSGEYWLFEYVRRQIEKSDSEIAYETTVLACVNPQRGQYAIFVHELGLEHRYLSEKGDLQIGEKIYLKVANVSPRLGLLTFTLSSRYGGKSTKFAPAA